MFLITKDIQLIINSDFRRKIVFSFKIAVMAPLTPSERAKRYWEKNKKKVREQEALRKKLRGLEMQLSNPEKNKARLLKEQLYKPGYRKEWKINHYQFRTQSKKGSVRGPHIWGQLQKLKSHFLEVQGRRMLLCQIWQKCFCCVYYLIIHKVIQDDQSKILMQTRNLVDWLLRLPGYYVHHTRKTGSSLHG